MLFPLSILIIPAIAGIAVFQYLDLINEKIYRICIGAISGLSVFTALTYAASIFFPITSILLGILLGLLILASGYFFKKSTAHWKKIPLDKQAVAVLIVACALSFLIAPKLLYQDETGLHTGVLNAYGDVGWHIANITMFAAGQSVPPEDPILSNTDLAYPFLSNFLSGLLLIGGATFQASVVLPALLLIPLIITLLYCFIREVTNGNKTAGWIGVILFIFWGATFGWLRFASDMKASTLPLFEFLFHLPSRDFVGSGGDPDGYFILNPLTSLLLPQRSFLFGIPLALSILQLLIRPHKNMYISMICAGILSGLLPLFHAHTVLALIPIILLLIVRSPGTQWTSYFLTAALVGIPSILYYVAVHTSTESFFRFEPRWMAEDTPLYIFWWKNTGLLLPLSIISIFYKRIPAIPRLLAITGTGLFIIANLFVFAPWVWDNFKIFIYWFIFLLPALTFLISETWHKFSFPIFRIILILLILIHTTSAMLDIWKIVVSKDNNWLEWPTDAIQLAHMIDQSVPKGESIITAPIHNSPVALAGRPLYMGFPGHIWSHGGDYYTRDQNLKSIYSYGRIPASEPNLPHYILVGPQERGIFDTISIPPTWNLLLSYKDYNLFELPH